MKKLLKKNILVLLVSLLLTGTFGVANARSVEAGVLDQTSTLVYNDDLSGRRISDALYDDANYYGPRSSDSHIWFGDISSYNSNNGYHGDAFWRVVDRDESYNGTKGMMWLTSEFTFTPVQNEHGGLETTFRLLFSDVEKAAMTTEGHEADEDFKYYKPSWYGSTAKFELDEEHKLFSLSAKELQKQFSTHLPTYVGSSSKTNAESAAYAAKKRERTLDLREDAEEYWMRQSGYYYAWDWFTEKAIKMEGRGNVSNELGGRDLALNINRGRCGTRPSFTLDLSKVLFMSPAKDADGVKSNDPGFKTVESFERNTTYGENWKLTLLDENRTLNVDSAVYTDATKNYVKISYSNATVGDNDYISAFVVNDNNEVKYFGRFLTFNKSSNNKGEFTLDLSNINTSKSDRIFLFSEKANGDYLTDYASMPVQVEIELKQNFPVVTFEKGNEQATGITTSIYLQKEEEKVTLPKCGYEMPAESGMKFLGWKKKGRTTRFLPGEEITINADTTYVAEWGRSWAGLQEKINNTASGGTITLDDDYYATEGDVWLIIPAEKTITIDLNGHKLDRNAVPSTSILDSGVTTVDKGSVFFVNGPGTVLNINDSTGKGTITGGCAHSELNTKTNEMGATAGGITVWNGAVVNFNGGTITNNYGELAGGVAVEGGTFNFGGEKATQSNAKITQNNGLIAGAVLAITMSELDSKSTFTMTNGEITSNFNKGFGAGGVYVVGNSEGNFEGGSISSNVGLMAGGVFVSEYKGGKPAMNVSGSPIIKDNMTLASEGGQDVVLNSGSKINVTGTLADTAKIGVYTLDKPTAITNLQFTTGLNGKGSETSFISNDPQYIVIKGSAERVEQVGEAYLSKKIDLVFYEDSSKTKEIETIPSFTEKLITLPDCKITKEGKTFDSWTIVAVPELADDMKVNAYDCFYVVRNFINSDQQVIIYANWVDHTHDMQHVDAKAATCETVGNTEYWYCDGCKKYFSDAEGKNEITLEQTVIDATGHDWATPTYTWTDDYSTVTAERICKNDSSHKDTLTKNTTSSVTKEANCVDKGETTYTATFTETGFANQTKTIANIDALGHDWGAWVIVKNPTDKDEGSKTRTCKRQGCSKTETAIIPKTTHIHDPQPVEGKAATCEENGYVAHWKCSDTNCGKLFLKDQNNKYYEVQKSDIVLYSKGHIYINPEYTWAADHSSVTATITCKNDSNHKITETHTTTEEGDYKIEISGIGATCTTSGRTIYIATFKDPHFTTQTSFVVTNAPTGHKWGELVVDTAPTCSTVGKGHQNCENDKSHVKDNIVIPKTDHEWVVDDKTAYVWADDNSSVTATATCKNNCGETLTETKATTTRVIKPATDTETGILEYRATFDNLIFADQTKTVTIPKKLAVTFMVNGSFYTKTLVDSGQKVERPEDPVKLCYDFTGWYAVDASKPFDFDTQITNNLTLNAGFTPKVYTITYNLAGGSLPEGKENPETYTIESADITLVNPSKEHSTFVGWTGTDLPLETENVVIPTGSFGNRVYYAVFKVDSKDVTVNLDPMKYGQLDETSVTKGSWLPYGDLPVPTVSQKDVFFDAWYTSPTFEEGSRIDSSTIVSTETEHTIYARYKFAVYFKGSDTPIDPEYVYVDRKVAEPEKQPEKSGYIYDYWAKADGSPFDFASEQASPGLTLMASYHRYASTINDNVWVLGDLGNLRFRFVRYKFMISESEDTVTNLKADFEKNEKQIFVDDNLLAENQYVYDNGSLILNLKDSYLNKLSAGRHTLRVDFTDGTAMADFTVIERIKPVTPTYIPPKTGN
ncbi:MAG: InlB B-repeat-containing protein [Erysipelotrichaceae bacterium]|nr:InlB B-repeat-containing protein [Erysipelotrichaceae bacterium]